MRKKVGRPAKVEAKARAVELLARGYSQSHVARTLGVSKSIVSMWAAEGSFSAAVAEQSEELGQQTRASFMDLRDDAVRCLRKAMADGGAAGVRASIEVLRVAGVTNIPVIPPRINDLYRGKTIEVRFVAPNELPQRPADLPAAAGGSGDNAADAQS